MIVALAGILRGIVYRPERTALTELAIAAAFALLLIFEGFEAGLYRQVHDFAAGLPGDLVAMQPGVANILGARSVLPQSARSEVEALPGVAAAHPLAALPVIYSRDNDVTPVFVIAYDTAGGPSTLVAGRPIAAEREIVVDQTLAVRYDLAPGARVEFLGQRFTIAGLSGGTSNPFNPYVYARLEDLIDLSLAGELPDEVAESSLSFLLIDVLPGHDVPGVRTDIERRVPSVDAFTPMELAGHDVLRTKGLMGPAIAVLVGAAYLVSVLVVAVTMYAAILDRRGEIAIMKAVGTRTGSLAVLVIAETVVACALAFVLAIPVAAGLASLLRSAAPQYAVMPLDASVLRHTAATLLAVAALGAIAPMWQMARVDAATALRRIA